MSGWLEAFYGAQVAGDPFRLGRSISGFGTTERAPLQVMDGNYLS